MQRLCAGNWKMNGLRADGMALARALVARTKAETPPCDLLLCPPATLLTAIADVLAGSVIALGGQDCHEAEKGAFTGDVSAAMLKDAGCRHVILGHSERRAGHGESDALVRRKFHAAMRAELSVILCIGETLAERDAGATLAVIERQLHGSLPEGTVGAPFAVAYEPVWAIGTGRTPTISQVQETHRHIRRLLSGRARDPAAVRILYGGSVKPDNAVQFMSAAEVDGALVGGASLVADDFWAIASACGG